MYAPPVSRKRGGECGEDLRPFVIAMFEITLNDTLD